MRLTTKEMLRLSAQEIVKYTNLLLNSNITQKQANIVKRIQKLAQAQIAELKIVYVNVYADIVLDRSTTTVTANGKEMPITQREFEILNLLLDAQGSTVPKDRFCSDGMTNMSLRSHIKNIRRKLEATGTKTTIEGVHGIGYRLKK